MLAATWLQFRLGGGLGQPFLAVLVATYSLGAHSGMPATLLGPASVAALAGLVDLPRLREGVPWDEVVPAWFMLAGLWVLGRWVRHRRAEATGLRARTEVAERAAEDRARAAEERARAAVADERARIARELHDLVAHSMGVIVLQAQGAQRSLDADPGRARTALESIESAGRSGLAELRRLLGLLTWPTEAPMDEPQPSLDRLDELVAGVREAGARAHLTVTGEVRQLPAGVELTAYRVAQEALTNVLRHAPGAAARVSADYGRDRITVTVTDDGPGRTAATEGSGRGLVGMRERVALYGGELEAGPAPAGGFRVVARLSIEAAP